MNLETTPLLESYGRALAGYLREGDDARRAQAYTLGRQALAGGVGLIELINIHREVEREEPGTAARSFDFLAEVAGPYEMALRGYREANASLKELSANLEREVEARTRALREAEQRLRSMVENLPAVTYVASGSPPRMVYLSPQVEALLGERASALVEVGCEWLDRVESADRDRVEESFAEREPGTHSRLEYRLRSRDGKRVWIRDEAMVIVSPGSGEAVRQGIWTDITEMRTLEEQLLHSQKMDAIGQLAGGVAHDFNNVLTAILSFGGFVLEDLPPDHPSVPDLTEVVKAGHRGAALTRQLLALGRRSVFTPMLLELNDLVTEMQRLLHRLIGEQLKLEPALTPDPWPVLADRGQLEQVLLNLVVNARDAQPEGGEIRIETGNVTLDGRGARLLGSPPGEYAMLAVTDRGVGMDAETRERIFEPYFTTKPKGKGTGLGLAVVIGIVRDSGGDLAVESEPGRGTTFRVYLPRAKPQAPAETETRTERKMQAGSETVLLVEDEAPVRVAARRILVANGYEVLEAANAGEAEALSEKHPGEIALLVTDVVMPECTGPDLATRLRARRPGMRVLFMSGYTGEIAVHEAVLASGARCLQKPFTPRSLAEQVRAVLDDGAEAEPRGER